MKLPQQPWPLRRACAIVACCAMVLVLAGCRNSRSQRQDYIRELREQEDEIYQLEDYLAEYQHLLKQQRKENARLKKELAEAGGVAKPSTEAEDGPSELPFGGSATGGQSSILNPPPREDGDSGDGGGGLPEIDLGDPITPGGEDGDPLLPNIDLGEPVSPDSLTPPATLPDGLQGARRLPTGTQLASAEEPAPVFELPPPPGEPADSVAIYAEQALTEAQSEVQLGLHAMVEPLRRDGSAGEFHGPVSLMIVDPIANNEDQKLVRWDLPAQQVEQSWRDSSRRVLDLALAIPEDVPVGRPLELWVRLEPAAGEKMLSRTTIEIAPRANVSGVTSLDRSSATAESVRTAWAAATVAEDESESDAEWQAADELLVPRPVPNR